MRQVDYISKAEELMEDRFSFFYEIYFDMVIFFSSIFLEFVIASNDRNHHQK